MRLRFKVILAGAGILLAVCHVLLWIVMSNKGPVLLERTLTRQLGMHLAADRVKFSLLSQGLKVKNLRVTDLSDPNGPPVFTAKKVLVRFNLFALLAKRITLRKIVFFSPTFTLTRNQEGKIELPDTRVAAAGNAGGAPGPLAQTPKAAQKTGSFFALRFYKMEVRNGEIRYSDRTTAPPFWVRMKNIRIQGEFLRGNVLRFNADGVVECQNPAPLRVSGDIGLKEGKLDGRLAMELDDLDVTLLSPYYQSHFPMTIARGKLFLRSRMRCDRGMLEDSVQSVTLKDLKIASWRQEFLEGTVLGMPARDFVEYAEQNGSEINFDFSISGSLQDIFSLQHLEGWKIPLWQDRAR